MLLLVILSIAGVLQYGVQNVRDKLWKKIICEVSASCLTCKATDSANQTLPKGGKCPN